MSTSVSSPGTASDPNVRTAEGGDADLTLSLAGGISRAGEPARMEDVLSAISGRCCWLAEVGGKPAGVAFLGPTFFGRPFLQVVRVAPGFERRGVGAALVKRAIDWAAPHALFTSANRTNGAGTALFEKIGFIRVGQIDWLDPRGPEVIFVFEQRQR